MADYSDIFNYIMNTAPTERVTAYSQGQFDIDPKYKDVISLVTNSSGGDDPRESQSLNIDWSKLPNGGMTKFGRLDSVIPAMPPDTPLAAGQSRTVKDPGLVYNDPNFGWVTPASNRKQTGYDKVNDFMPLIIMAAATAGLGAIGLPALAGAIPGLGKAAGGFSGPGAAAYGAPAIPGTGAVPQTGAAPARGIGAANTKIPQIMSLLQRG